MNIKIYPFQREEIVEKYLSGMGPMEISKAYGCSPSTIDYVLKKCNITLRKTIFPRRGIERLRNSLY
jgi:intein-encoded DNA endonuclease-like protein